MAAPKLRFKRFTQQWNNDLLINLSQNGLSNGVFNDPANTGSGYKLINVVNMYKESSVCESDLTLIALDKKTFEKNKVHYSDIFFTRSSLVKEGIAWSNIYLGNSNDVTYDGHLIKLTPNLDKVYPIFLSYCLKTSAIRQQLIKKGKTATMTTIGQEDVASCVVFFPCIEEQTKIANFLSAVDERIQQVSQNHALLTQYKKGVMQKIFSQELRFKDENGEEFGEWNTGTLKASGVTVIDGDRGNNYPSKSDFLDDGFCLFLNAGNVTKSGFKFSQNSYISANKDAQLRKGKLKRKDIVLTTRGTVGNAAYYTNNIPYDNIRINSGMVLLRAERSISPNYLYCYLTSSAFEKWLEKVSFGSAQPQLTVKIINDFIVSYPSIAEQTKIASFLSAIDDKINQAQSQLTALQEYKRGLLQQMFV